MTSKPERPFAIIGQGTIFDGIAYWATLVGVYVMVGGLMFYSGKGKLFDDDGNAPQGIKDQFAGTFIDTFPGAEFEIMDAHLEPGDTFLAFTDGVTDARNPAGKLFHEEGLIELIRPPLNTANGLLDRIDNALQNYISDAVQFDDITMVAAYRMPEA